METPSKPEYNTRIRELPASERPRERLRDLGSSALTTAELLAILMRTGGVGQNVVHMAESLLARHRGLRGLAHLSFEALLQEKGIGEAKAAELRAVFELANRLNALPSEDRLTIRSPQDVMNFLGGELSVLDQEHLYVILVNTRNQVLGTPVLVYKGNVSSAVVRGAEVFRDAIQRNAPSIVLVHNHPSGDPAPSPDDVAMTKQCIEAGKLLDIEVLDHIVIGEQRFASLKAMGLV